MYSSAFDSFIGSQKEKEKGLRMPVSSGAVTVKCERYACGKKLSSEEQF